MDYDNDDDSSNGKDGGTEINDNVFKMMMDSPQPLPSQHQGVSDVSDRQPASVLSLSSSCVHCDDDDDDDDDDNPDRGHHISATADLL